MKDFLLYDCIIIKIKKLTILIILLSNPVAPVISFIVILFHDQGSIQGSCIEFSCLVSLDFVKFGIFFQSFFSSRHLEKYRPIFFLGQFLKNIYLFEREKESITQAQAGEAAEEEGEADSLLSREPDLEISATTLGF